MGETEELQEKTNNSSNKIRVQEKEGPNNDITPYLERPPKRCGFLGFEDHQRYGEKS